MGLGSREEKGEEEDGNIRSGNGSQEGRKKSRLEALGWVGDPVAGRRRNGAVKEGKEEG